MNGRQPNLAEKTHKRRLKPAYIHTYMHRYVISGLVACSARVWPPCEYSILALFFQLLLVFQQNRIYITSSLISMSIFMSFSHYVVNFVCIVYITTYIYTYTHLYRGIDCCLLGEPRALAAYKVMQIRNIHAIYVYVCIHACVYIKYIGVYVCAKISSLTYV